MTDARQGVLSDTSWRRIRVALELFAITGALVVLILMGKGRLSENEQDWAWIAFGLLYGFHVRSDALRGRTHVTRYASAEDPTDYVRDADPIGFRILIALKGALAAALVIGALGELLGFWNLSRI
jgi:hypothetical protein